MMTFRSLIKSLTLATMLCQNSRCPSMYIFADIRNLSIWINLVKHKSTTKNKKIIIYMYKKCTKCKVHYKINILRPLFQNIKFVSDWCHFQQYFRFYLWRKPDSPKKTIELSQVTRLSCYTIVNHILESDIKH